MAEPQAASALVHIIDDDDHLSAALVRLLRSAGHDGRAYASVAAFLAAEREDRPGCVLLDVKLPGISGLEFQEQMADHGLRQPVIMMTGHGDIPTSVRAMKAGAVDFLEKPFAQGALFAAIASALDQDRLRLSIGAARRQASRRYGLLSQRERAVFGGVIDGLLNREIATRLGLSIVTVKTHRGSLMRKMEARSVADLVRAAKAMGCPGA